MSQENVESARRLYDVRNRGDVEAVIAECHREVEWHPHLSSLGGQPIRGHDGVRRYLDSLADEWTEFRQEPEEFLEAGETVVALLRTRAVGRGSGARVDMPVAHVLTFEDGQCIKSVTHVDRAGALAAAGLRG